MSTVIGLTGAQGAGKSTLLKEMFARCYDLDDFQVARVVQKELGWASLDAVMESPQTMMNFQNRIFDAKYAHDLSLRVNPCGHGIMLVERTFADIMSYTTLWAWKFVDAGMWKITDAIPFLATFSERCRLAQVECYQATVVLPMMSHVVFEVDPHRAKERDVSRFMEEVEMFLQRRVPVSHKIMRISTKTVEERADEFEDFLRNKLWT